MIHSLLLKAAATLLTLGAAAAAAVHVSGHVKNSSAPLHPGVLGPSAVSSAADGRLTLKPSVKSADVAPITSTYSS